MGGQFEVGGVQFEWSSVHAATAYGAGVGIVFGGADGEDIVGYGEVCAEHGCFRLFRIVVFDFGGQRTGSKCATLACPVSHLRRNASPSPRLCSLTDAARRNDVSSSSRKNQTMRFSCGSLLSLPKTSAYPNIILWYHEVHNRPPHSIPHLRLSICPSSTKR